jgi:hypothetical protein
MATSTAKRPPIIRQTFCFGTKKIQAGVNKGGVKVAFIAVPARTAAAIGLKLELPKAVPGTNYTLQNGLIFDNHTTSAGKKVKSPIKSKVGSKKVTVFFKAATKNGVGVRKLNGPKGSKKGRPFEGDNASIEIGIPAWADIVTTRAFLKNSKVKKFSFGGGEPYNVKVVESK